MNESHDDLVQAAGVGDVEAIRALLAHHVPGLRGYLRRNAGPLAAGRESVGDLVQSICREVLEHVADGRLEYRGERAFKEWLYRAALIKVLNRQRFWKAEKREAGKQRPLVDDADRGVTPPVASDPSPSQGAADRERLVVLESAFHQLDTEQQAIIFLAYVEELSHKEIAERLGIGESHSRSKLSRAIARLARIATSGPPTA